MHTATDHIEDYLNHQLSEKERKGFEEKLESDRDFAGKVEEHALILNAFDEIKAKTLMDGFKGIEDELEGGKERKLGFPVSLKWAATVIILAVLSLAIYLNSGVSEKDLFLSYYVPYPNMEHPVSRSGASGADVWQRYESGDYAEAYRQFEQALVVDEADYGSRFYLGISALELNRLTVAEAALSAVAANKESNYTEQAQWYLALTFLKANKIKKAKIQLKQIDNSISSYKTEANKLLRDLR